MERRRQLWVIRQHFHSDDTAQMPQASRNNGVFDTRKEIGSPMILKSAGGLDMNHEVRQLVISQLLVIIVPVGLMFALWVSLLTKNVQR